jgi:hypothetical protein
MMFVGLEYIDMVDAMIDRVLQKQASRGRSRKPAARARAAGLATQGGVSMSRNGPKKGVENRDKRRKVGTVENLRVLAEARKIVREAMDEYRKCQQQTDFEGVALTYIPKLAVLLGVADKKGD